MQSEQENLCILWVVEFVEKLWDDFSDKFLITKTILLI